jgi:hypothetical protein
MDRLTFPLHIHNAGGPGGVAKTNRRSARSRELSTPEGLGQWDLNMPRASA